MPATAINPMTSTDRIEKTVVLRAPRTRVWRAIANSSEFGQWFRVKFDGDFSVGKTISGKIQIPGFDHVPMEMHIESIEPESYFSYRWHPYAIEAGVDYSKEPTTLVEFRLEDAAEGTRLTILESGFDKIPAGRRAEAFRMNDNGWTSQAKAIEKYVSAS